jgi:enamine deaminase RidA (YjgF/YER057c/UK114 family)
MTTKGNIVGQGNMEVQMLQAYANIEKVLAQYGADSQANAYLILPIKHRDDNNNVPSPIILSGSRMLYDILE